MDDCIKATKVFIERSRKITKAQEAVLEAQAKLAKKEEALEDGLKRLNSLQQEADGLSEQPPPPTAPDFARELAELRACVQALQVERDDLRAEVARQNVEGRQRNARSLAVPSPDLVMGDNSVQFRSARNSSSVMETSSTKQIRVSSRTVAAKYGLRGIRVGEASHPGPRASPRNTFTRDLSSVSGALVCPR